MILEGNQRGGAKDLALHLLKDENDHVDVHELRGFVSDGLVSALHEAYAVSRATKCKQFLFSLSLNPPPEEKATTADFENAIEQVEEKLGLTDQPRAIVFHEKNGRRHAHCVWSRIKTDEMKAVHLSRYKTKLADVSRELYISHGWNMPKGFMRSEERDPNNFTMAQWQQAKRAGKDPRAIKQALRDCWAVSDSQAAFQSALKERGFILAKGDRRGFVVIDMACEIYSVAKWTDLTTKDIKTKLKDKAHLPPACEAKEQMAKAMASRLAALEAQRHAAIEERAKELEQKRLHMAQRQRQTHRDLSAKQQDRTLSETKARQVRFTKGLKGFWERLTGARRRIEAQNEYEAYEALKRDKKEKDAVILKQLEERQALQARIQRLQRLKDERLQPLTDDIRQYEQIKTREREYFRWRGRDGPEMER